MNQIWAQHLKKHIDMIENVQRRGTKLQLTTLANQRTGIRGDLIEVFEILNTDCGYDKSLSPFLLSRTSNTRGHKYKLIKH